MRFRKKTHFFVPNTTKNALNRQKTPKNRKKRTKICTIQDFFVTLSPILRNAKQNQKIAFIRRIYYQ